jgi:hypothetical protein
MPYSESPASQMRTNGEYSMPNSTKLERLMYEQYRIEQAGINNLINDRNALAFKNLAARKRYEVRIPKIIAKYNLPK